MISIKKEEVEKKYNPYYEAYAKAHNKTPDEMLDFDKIAWPGGKMCGFILWINEQWSKWFRERGLKRNEYALSENDRESFRKQLEERNNP